MFFHLAFFIKGYIVHFAFSKTLLLDFVFSNVIHFVFSNFNAFFFLKIVI